jgi:hypothetical protein
MPANDRRFDNFSKTGLVSVIQALEDKLQIVKKDHDALVAERDGFRAAPWYRRVWLSVNRRVS